MYGFSWIHKERGKNVLAIAPMPASRDDWKWIRMQGIEAVLSLEPPAERGYVQSQFDHRCQPWPDNIPPTADDERVYAATLPELARFMAHRIESDRPVLVHCMAGKDRTGLMLAYFFSRWKQPADGLPAARDVITRLRLQLPRILSAQGYYDMAVRLIDAHS